MTSGIEIPRDRLKISFSRSGGPGGQNVNKVATRVEVRFQLDAADWLPDRVKSRLREKHARRINQDGEFFVVSSRYREQKRNLEDCLRKLREWIEDAALIRTPRKRTRPTRASRERRLQGKQRRSQLKAERRAPRLED